MTFGSLFAGIGGMDLGLERAGMVCKWQVEINEYCRRVLTKHWPAVPKWDDVRTFPPSDGEWGVDLIAGGFPCQDVSVAGRREGIKGERSGLWREFARIIRILRPGFVLVENVPGLFDRGFGNVLGDLAACGFDAEWSSVSACSMGAPFVRERVFIVAFPKGQRQGQLRGIERTLQGEEKRDLHWQGIESRVPRIARGIPDSLERLTAIGNAVVPQVAEWIGRRIMEAVEAQQ